MSFELDLCLEREHFAQHALVVLYRSLVHVLTNGTPNPAASLIVRCFRETSARKRSSLVAVYCDNQADIFEMHFKYYPRTDHALLSERVGCFIYFVIIRDETNSLNNAKPLGLSNQEMTF